jgi:hypothetical protein
MPELSDCIENDTENTSIMTDASASEADD